jgi:hypothetical protein
MYSPFYSLFSLQFLAGMWFYRFKNKSIVVFIAAVAMAGYSCKKSPAMFEQLSASDTGIRFENKLLKKDLLNILYYLYYYNGGGVAAGDINNDGLTDLYFTGNNVAANKLYLNKGNFEFEDITEKAGVAGTAEWCTGATMADVNGDGLLDIYVCAVSKQFGLEGRNMLFINKGNNTFQDEAITYGLNFAGLSTQAAFFDYDHDGDLDCYLLNHSKKPHSNVVDTINRRKVDEYAGDRLYRNNLSEGQSAFTDVSAQAGIYQSSLGYGLGLAVADFNNDGWEDIYVGNDFHENDYYYLNNRNGTFSESSAAHFGHYSRFSMGNDAADFDNDGQIDVVTVDMLPPDEKTLKTYGSDENPNMYKAKLTMNGYQDQFSRNCLQRNNGNGVSFSDVALLAGVSSTDWSWSPLFADFDNDGNKDLFISSGIVKRPVDMDYVLFVSAMQQNKGLEQTDKYDEETIAKMPDGSSHPFFFKGQGNLQFSEVSKDWGTANMKGYFNGASYADLNNDGKLDVVINCIDAPAVILRNNNTAANQLTISFKGEAGNKYGVGARAYVFSSGKMQYQQLMPTRGFMSAGENRLYFGLGNAAKADSVLLVWPDQRFQVLKNIPAGKPLIAAQQQARDSFHYEQYFPAAKPSWQDVTASTGISWKHNEDPFVDFNRQYLIPHMQSTRGPKLAVADVNKDGFEDFYVCGAASQAGALMIQTAGGAFANKTSPAFIQNAGAEEVDATFFDANGDGAPDLYVVSGGNALDDGHQSLADHLYLNDGRGNFTESTDALPVPKTNKSAVAAADVDADGDTDVFVGGLSNAAKYGYPQDAYLLLNDGKGKFALAPENIINLKQLGIVTAAAFADVNGDGKPDLLAAGEWMPLIVFANQGGKFVRNDVPGSTGLWQSLLVTDFNSDGKPDVLAGNWGLNNKLVSRKKGLVKMYVKDFDKNGSTEQIVCYTIDGKEYTFLAKDELERPLPVLKKAYLTYSEVAGETVQFMFYDLFKDYYEAKAETLASAVFLNDGKGSYKSQPLPADLQLAPLFAFAKTGKQVWAGGNFSGTVPYEGRYDGQAFTGFNSNFNITGSMPAMRGEWRDAKSIVINGKSHLLVARNNLPLLVLKPAEE